MAKSMEDQFPIIHKLSLILSIILNRKDEDDFNLYEPQSSKPKSSSADLKRKFITSKKIKKKRKNPLLKNDKSEEFKSSKAQAGSSRKLSRHEKSEVIIYMGKPGNNKANEDWNQENDSEEHKKTITYKKYKPKVDKSFMSSSSELSFKAYSHHHINNAEKLHRRKQKLKIIDTFELTHENENESGRHILSELASSEDRGQSHARAISRNQTA